MHGREQSVGLALQMLGCEGGKYSRVDENFFSQKMKIVISKVEASGLSKALHTFERE